MKISYNYGKTSKAPRNTYGSRYRKKYGKNAQSTFKRRYNPEKFKRWKTKSFG